MKSREPIVYIVDDDAAVRDSLTLMIEQAQIRVRAFENARAFLDAYRPDFFGCILIDVKMPDMDGLQLQEELSQRNIVLPVIFLTGHGDIPMSVRAMKAGAVDFLTKPVIREKLLICVRAAFIEAEKRVEDLVYNQDAIACLAKLTEREREVMILAVEGRSNKEIASYLGISYRTVEIHKSKIMLKTGASNLLDLARIVRAAN
ncbi:DNA-binding response regulator [Nitrosomonas sp. JL21]|uniref:response regulator transcription factor n=1 Tax=Nitrosomonas sp. JL21 TaxID=153949 RepID=UPI001367F8E6|nr:response regulator [Nitrosomonas sp. JL21]MBL8496382.1 response regulator transcription factor [Nitrosomonas sp.]MCC7091338.1 response regulator transcription factor [Nitrosomonas sp.]MXS77346.1 DNA-binding response regulator [Nitrosomonas sp. JL21]